MKRTAADFAREAPAEGPWAFALKSGRELSPRPRSHYTYAEQQAEADLSVAWGQWIEAQQRAAREELSVVWEQPESMFMFGLKTRFSAPDALVEARRAEKAGSEVDWPNVLADFNDFWSEAEHWPVDSIHALIQDLDAYYPVLGSEQEQSDADAHPQGAAAGKSSSAVASSTATAASSSGTSPTSAST